MMRILHTDSIPEFQLFSAGVYTRATINSDIEAIGSWCKYPGDEHPGIQAVGSWSKHPGDDHSLENRKRITAYSQFVFSEDSSSILKKHAREPQFLKKL